MLRSSWLVIVFSVTNSLPPGEALLSGPRPGPAVHAPLGPAAAPALADAAPGAPGTSPRPLPAARRSGLQLLDALIGRRAVWAGQGGSVSDSPVAAPGLSSAYLGCWLLVSLGLVVTGQLTGGNWTLSSRKLNSMFVCLFIRLFVYSLGFSSVMGFSLVVFILESLFSSGNGGFLFTVTTTVFSIVYSVSSRLSISFIASVVTLVRDFQDLFRFPFSVGIQYLLGLML